ncbi:hypothetical protein VNO77_46466 [Canavalia gladiata]|uniref:Uncharacterized protein n=1 Tax=Canavalia gladiata TaxID=3824 RepID=A0AAN9JJ95_CANGL
MPTNFRGTHQKSAKVGQFLMLDDRSINHPKPWVMDATHAWEGLCERGGEVPWQPRTNHCGRGWGEVLGAWCLVLGAWCLVLGAWCLVLGAWCLVLGAWCLVLGAWCLVLGAWCLVLGAWCLVLGAWCLVLGAWCLVLGAWCLVLGAWCLVLGAWCLVLGAWCLVLGGAWCLVLGAWCLVLGAWCLVLGAWCLVLGAWCLVLGAWCLVLVDRGSKATLPLTIPCRVFKSSAKDSTYHPMGIALQGVLQGQYTLQGSPTARASGGQRPPTAGRQTNDRRTHRF